jgi:hypothetical protein
MSKKKADTPQDNPDSQDPSKVENKGVVTKVEGQEETPEGQEKSQQETGDGAEYETGDKEPPDDDPGADDEAGSDDAEDEEDTVSNVILNEKETVTRKLDKIKEYKESEGYADLDAQQKTRLSELEHAYSELHTALGLIGTKEFKGSVIGKTQPKANPALPEFHL